MDSSTLLLRLLADGYEVTALSFDYGQKHRVELERAQSLVNYLNSQIRPLGYPKITYQVIKLDGLTELLNSALVSGGDDVPEGHYAEDNMKATVVPNRNKIFSSIIQSVALSIANEKETEVKIAMGIHSGDHAIYPDCRQEFRDLDYQAFVSGNWDSERVTHYTPYLDGDKFTILEDGVKACEQLNIDFDEVYKKTNTSYKPIFIGEEVKVNSPGWVKNSNTVKNGKWYSDFKSASSVERVEAFIKLGRKDPVEYADENGPVEWDTVVSHVEQVLASYEG
jgi:7-cyano-7-deazaguanine synthase